MYTIKNIIIQAVGLVVFLFLFGACSKDDSDANQSSLEDFKFSGTFTGIYTNNTFNTSSETEGYLTIDDNGNITVELFIGGMYGTAVLENEIYNITISQASGLFKNASNIDGVLNSVTGSLSLNITGSSDSSESLIGFVGPFLNSSNLSKSTILFTHDQTDCVASVTVNGITISGLQRFYGESNMCEPLYDIWQEITRDRDNEESRLQCYTGTIIGLDGNLLTFTECTSISFVVNKNTEYDYTVKWNNGEITTGQFKSPDGGKFITICPTSENCTGGGGTGNEPGTGQFIFNGTTYNAYCGAAQGLNCAGSGIDVILVPQSGVNSFVIYNMPVANSGTFTFADGEQALNTCDLYGILNGSSNLYVTESGSLTKTGANSFTFTSVIRNITSGGATTLEGSGSY